MKTTLLFFRYATSCMMGAAALAAAVMPAPADASALILNPSSGSYLVGSIIPVVVFVDTEGENINAVSGEITYAADVVRPVSIRVSDSVVNLWVQQPSIVANKDTITFEGLILNPGFSGRGKIATINFEVYKPGHAAITFTSGVALKNDGYGTNVLSRLSEAHFDTRGKEGDLIAYGDREELPVDPSELVFDSLRPPVVTGYTLRPKTLDGFSVQGVTYPGALVRLRLADETEQVESFDIAADGAGNFAYNHDSSRVVHPLLPASVLSAVRALVNGTQYRFWLTAQVQGAETDSTQMFEITVGGFTTAELLLWALFVLAVLIGAGILYVVYAIHENYRKPKTV